jgi:hypothetical protein
VSPNGKFTDIVIHAIPYRSPPKLKLASAIKIHKVVAYSDEREALTPAGAIR